MNNVIYFTEESAPDVTGKHYIGTSWRNEYETDRLIIEAIEGGELIIAIIREHHNGGRFEQTSTEYYYAE